jgi:PIN domain nuclease of toxin-antitoxin system
VTSYLDTNVVIFLIRGETKRLTKRARQAIDRDDLLVSPMIMLELNYLYETQRVVASGELILGELYQSIDLRICSLPFDRIVRMASKEAWTRDVFDRIIVSNAKANNDAPLISSDELIASHYANTIW